MKYSLIFIAFFAAFASESIAVPLCGCAPQIQPTCQPIVYQHTGCITPQYQPLATCHPIAVRTAPCGHYTVRHTRTVRRRRRIHHRRSYGGCYSAPSCVAAPVYC